MLHRALAITLHRTAQQHGIVVVHGPRGSGKTTLLRREFPAHTYLSLESHSDREAARHDPERFLSRLRTPAILDDLHRAPELIAHFSTDNQPGEWILASSRRLRIPHPTLELHPPTRAERERRAPMPLEILGRFPVAAGTHAAAAPDWPRDPRAYLDRDVRDLVAVRDLDRFESFASTLEARSGERLDQQELADLCGISHRTAVRWLQVLDDCFRFIRIPPADETFGRRLVRSPRLHSPESVRFESRVVTELYRNRCHAGEKPDFRHWRDSNGFGIPLLIDHVPIALVERPTPMDFDRLERWCRLANAPGAALITRHSATRPRGRVFVYSEDSL